MVDGKLHRRRGICSGAPQNPGFVHGEPRTQRLPFRLSGLSRTKRTPGGTRTRNPRLRRPMPYPLGHGGWPVFAVLGSYYNNHVWTPRHWSQLDSGWKRNEWYQRADVCWSAGACTNVRSTCSSSFVMLAPDNFRSQEWRLHEHIEVSKKTMTQEYSSSNRCHPALSVTCRASRRPGYFYWNVFLVMVRKYRNWIFTKYENKRGLMSYLMVCKML